MGVVLLIFYASSCKTITTVFFILWDFQHFRFSRVFSWASCIRSTSLVTFFGVFHLSIVFSDYRSFHLLWVQGFLWYLYFNLGLNICMAKTSENTLATLITLPLLHDSHFTVVSLLCWSCNTFPAIASVQWFYLNFPLHFA